MQICVISKMSWTDSYPTQADNDVKRALQTHTPFQVDFLKEKRIFYFAVVMYL